MKRLKLDGKLFGKILEIDGVSRLLLYMKPKSIAMRYYIKERYFSVILPKRFKTESSAEYFLKTSFKLLFSLYPIYLVQTEKRKVNYSDFTKVVKKRNPFGDKK